MMFTVSVLHIISDKDVERSIADIEESITTRCRVLLWYGMVTVWYGMVWYGMVWYGWHGMAWHAGGDDDDDYD